MNKSKYIILIFKTSYLPVNICNFNYDIALKLLNKSFIIMNNHAEIKNLIKAAECKIYDLFHPNAFFIHIHSKNLRPNYNLIKHLDVEHFHKFFNMWNDKNYNFGVYKRQIHELEQNYEKYMEEALIKDIIE